MNTYFHQNVFVKGIVIFALTFLSHAIAGNHQKADLAYFGDYDSDKVFVIDLQSMQLAHTLQTGIGPYGVDQQDKHSAYALTRKIESLSVIDTKTMTSDQFIYLPFTPRSTDYDRKKKRSLVSGKSDPMSCIIDVKTHAVEQCVGHFHNGSPMTDFGGGNATGHPFWVDKKHFFMLDRVSRSLDFFHVDGQKLAMLETETTVHHLLRDDAENYYAVLEGSQIAGIAPALLKFCIEEEQFEVLGSVHLTETDNAPDPAIMGGHHADFHPDGHHIYMGSYEGNLFVIDKETLQIVDRVTAGKGVGHVTFAPFRQLAITTNHYDTFMSVFDVSDPRNNKLIKKIEVANATQSGRRLQSHTSGVSPDEKFFYSVASNDGIFFEIDLDTLEVSRTLTLENGYVLMGSFVWHPANK